MAATLPGNPTDSPHKIVIKGKYLAAIAKYVSTLELDGNFLIKVNPEFESLQDVIAQLYSPFLSKENVVSIVFAECIGFESEQKDRSGSLSAPDNADLHAALVNRIKSYLETFPRHYTLRIDLPSFPVWVSDKYDISGQIRLVLNGAQSPPGNTLARALLNYYKEEPIGVGSTTYLEFSADGYSDWSQDSPAMSICLSLAKQLSFILTTYGVCKSDYTRVKATATLTDDYGTTGTIALPDSIARCFGTLIPIVENLLVNDDGRIMTLLTNPGRPAVTNEEKNMAFKERLYAAGKFFQAQDHAEFNSIAAAIEWYQDALFADNQTFSYVATCIGLEALFGSENHIEDMSKRLADRYAFLLGKSRGEREAMIAEYGKVLKLRGRLVHAKAARLSSDERLLLVRAKQMLLNAIWHEQHTMYRAIDAQQRASSIAADVKPGS